MKNKPWLAAFIALGTIWGLSFLFIEVALESFTAVGVALARQVLGAVTLYAVGFMTGQRLVTQRHLLKHFAVLAFLLNSFPSLMFALGQNSVSSSLAGILNATTPLFSVVFATLVFRSERLNLAQGMGLLLGFAGVVLLLGGGSEVGQSQIVGVLLILLATLGYGLAFAYARKFISNTGISPTSMAMTQLTFGVLFLLPAAPFVELVTLPIRVESFLAIAALGVLGTGLAYIWNFQVIERAGGTVASTVTYVSPLVATIAGIALLNETLHWQQLAGGAVILFSAALVQKRLTFKIKKG